MLQASSSGGRDLCKRCAISLLPLSPPPHPPLPSPPPDGGHLPSAGPPIIQGSSPPGQARESDICHFYSPILNSSIGSCRRTAVPHSQPLRRPFFGLSSCLKVPSYAAYSVVVCGVLVISHIERFETWSDVAIANLTRLRDAIILQPSLPSTRREPARSNDGTLHSRSG
jgi:hypothetical protein